MILICLVILIITGSFVVCHTYLLPEDLRQNQPQDPGSPGNQTGPGPVEGPGSQCNPHVTAPRVLVPVDTSVPIQDPMPGIRYSLNTSDSGRTIMLGKGDIIEINLKFAPGLAMRWTVPVSGCGLELVNDGIYSKGGDFWNVTDYYRARYRAVSPGTSVLNGRLVITDHAEKGDLWFNLTVIVK